MVTETPDSNSADSQEFAATMLGQNSQASSDQDVDLSFAAAILKSGIVTERRLSRAIATWTIHGNRRLAEHLQALDLISSQERDRLQRQADSSLQHIDAELTKSPHSLSHTQLVRTRMNSLDPTGRVARLLGLNGGGTLVLEHSSRKSHCEFSLIRKLGEGGLGTVWLARDENLRRYVAIKEIRLNNTSNDAVVERFRREAEITGRLEHPGIVPIYQFGNDPETGRFFYVMRFLGKSTLQDSINEYHERRESGNDVPVLRHRLLTAFVNLCKAVAHAHSRKVIHRDLKPENVAMNSFGQVVLLDWGLARYQDEAGGDQDVDLAEQMADSADVTLAGQVLGSPMWMAPEQAAGRLEEIDERTDVYGLGGILYAILTGNSPHESTHSRLANSGSSEASALLTAIMSQDVPRARSVLATVPPELDAICRRAMARKRYLRYRSAQHLADDVEDFLAGGKVSAYKASSFKQIQQWLGEHTRVAQVLAVVFVSLLFVVATGYLARERTAVIRERAQFAELSGVARELEFLLRADADALTRDLRFIANLSLVQQIIRDQQVRQPAKPLPSLSMRQSPGDQLSEVFTGLLRGRESYLSMTFLRHGNADSVDELVRSDRAGAGRWVRAVPTSRLARFSRGKKRPELKPNDVMLGAATDVTDAPTQARNGLVIFGATPVYSETSGENYGVMMTEMDLRYLLLKQLEVIAGDADVFVADKRGKILLRFHHGAARPHGNKTLASEFPQLADFVSDSEAQRWSDERIMFAQRIILGERFSNLNTEILIVVRNAESVSAVSG